MHTEKFKVNTAWVVSFYLQTLVKFQKVCSLKPLKLYFQQYYGHLNLDVFFFIMKDTQLYFNCLLAAENNVFVYAQ